MKFHELKSTREEFHRRSKDRMSRMQGLVELFQRGDIDSRRFRHLSGLLKAEHRTDCRENGVPVCEREFK